MYVYFIIRVRKCITYYIQLRVSIRGKSIKILNVCETVFCI